MKDSIFIVCLRTMIKLVVFPLMIVASPFMFVLLCLAYWDARLATESIAYDYAKLWWW